MITGDLTLNAPIMYEMWVKIAQHQQALSIGDSFHIHLDIEQDMYDELIELLPPDERYIYCQEGLYNLVFMGRILVPY